MATIQWSKKQRDGHSLHQIPYRACFKPSLATAFINHFSQPGDLVYDPFSGRGTTILEAAILGRRGVANDLNPLMPYLLRPRLAPPTLPAVEARLAQLDLSYTDAIDEQLLVFYHEQTLRELMALRKALSNDQVDGWIKLCTLSRLTGHSSGYLSVYTLPPNQATSVEAQRRINAKRNQEPDYRDVRTIVLKKTRQLLKDGVPTTYPPDVNVTTGDARHNKLLQENSVDLVLTSPPFVAEVTYTDDNWLRNWFIGLTPPTLDEDHKAFEWTNFIYDALVDQRRVLKSGGTLCMEVGNTKSVDLCALVVDLCTTLKFVNVNVVEQSHDPSKTAAIWGAGKGKGTNKSFVVCATKN